jgi:hypothetical protein
MREYMRNYYNENKEECRAYKNSVKCRKQHNLSAKELKEYGNHLADIYKLRQIKAKLPTERLQRI